MGKLTSSWVICSFQEELLIPHVLLYLHFNSATWISYSFLFSQMQILNILLKLMLSYSWCFANTVNRIPISIMNPCPGKTRRGDHPRTVRDTINLLGALWDLKTLACKLILLSPNIGCWFMFSVTYCMKKLKKNFPLFNPI